MQMERGSQFKIESVLCRTTKQNEYLTLSATKEQVANQAVLECRPFVMEPPKEFYSEYLPVYSAPFCSSISNHSTPLS